METMTKAKTTNQENIWTGPMKLTVMDQPFINKAIDLADSISKFKTKEMELAFADFLIKATHPPIMAEPLND